MTMQTDSYSKRDPLIPILILIVAILGVGSGLIVIGRNRGIPILFSIGQTIIISGGLWLICRTYVKFLWRNYPWETSPALHTILEVLGITALTLAYGFLLYTLELRLGVSERVENLGIEIFITLLITYLITGIHEMVFFYRQWIRNFSRSVRLEKDNIEARYESLKTQVNPHFLFNSLNSLTNMVDDNPRAVGYIQHLSEFLRYVLGSRDKDLACLKDELQVLDHYLELQKSRFPEYLKPRIEIPEKFHLYALPPLALQMLAENCIKHNVISREKPLTITIHVRDERVVVSNNLQRKTRVDSTGQGLRNIIERYRYFTSREVTIRETDKVYEVSLPLLIAEL